MRKFLLLALLALNAVAGDAQFINYSVEVENVWYGPVGAVDFDGYITYRVYANFENETDFLSAIYGNQLFLDQPFVVTPDAEDITMVTDCSCYNNDDFGGFVGSDVSAIGTTLFPEVGLDTWWTIGLENDQQAGTLFFATTASDPAPADISAAGDPCSAIIDDGAVFTLSGAPNGLAGPDFRVLIAQITTCSDVVELELCMQVFVESSQQNDEYVCTPENEPFVFENPCVANPFDTELTVVEDLLCNGQTATVEIGGGGNDNVTYELFEVGDLNPITTQENNPQFTDLPEGNYFIAMVDDIGCRDTTETFFFVEPPLLEVSVEQTADNLCANDAQAEVCVDVIGGVTPYTIEATDAGGSTNSIQSGECFTGLGCVNNDGTYTVLVTDFNGCTYEEEIVVSCPAPLVLETTAGPIQCNAANDGTLNIEVSGGTGTLSVETNIPDFVTVEGASPVSIDIENISPGSYTVTITDENGCTVSDDLEFIEPAALSAEVSANDMQCAGTCNGEVIWEASGGTPPYSIEVFDTDGNPSTETGLCAGDYLAIITDSNECEFEAPFSVNEPEPITYAVTLSDVSCFGAADGQICISEVNGGTGEVNWQISAPPSESTPYGNLPCFEGLIEESYVVNFQDEAGCVVTENGLNINEPDQLELITVVTQISCTGEGDGIILVDYIGGTGESSLLLPEPLALPATLGNLDFGSYDLLIEDETGCQVSTNVEIIDPDSLFIEVLATTDISCGGDCDGTVELDFGGGTGELTLLLNDVPSETIGLCANDYIATVVDANGCEATAEFTIIQPDPIEFLINVNPVTCTGMNDGTVNIFPTGGVAPITWEIVEDVDINNLFEGTYTITGTDATGCPADTVFTVTAEIETDMEVEVFSSPVTCWNEADGTATAAVTGGTPPITYQWDDENNQVTATAIGLPEDNYTVTVTDAIGCNLSFLVEVEPTVGCFFIATAITPNGDGSNDDWVIGGLEYFPQSSVQVYNRWGQLLFESRGYSTRWDATWNGRRVPVADYYFVITYDPNKEPITGTVTVKY